MNPACFTETRDSKIKLDERGRKVVLLNKDRVLHVRAQVDGCLLAEEIAADWVVSRSDLGDLIVELKGTDVGHALKQVERTLIYWIDNKLRKGRIGALIVCSRYPRNDTSIQRAKAAFMRDHRALLTVVSRNLELLLDDLV